MSGSATIVAVDAARAQRPDGKPGPTLTFTRMVPDAIPPMRADKAALGYIPTPAFQYCEAMRMASSHGWYAFPPADIQLRWNGADVLVRAGDAWEPLSFAYLPGFVEHWDAHCPEDFRGLALPYLRALPSNGAVQVWSGWLVGAAPDWSVLVRPLANVRRSNFYYCYEGVIDNDTFQPCPLFINLQLTATEVTITLSRFEPLFQVQPIHRSCYGDVARGSQIREGFETGDSRYPAMNEENWRAFRRTFRTDQPDETHRFGDYAAETRKRRKHEVETGSVE